MSRGVDYRWPVVCVDVDEPLSDVPMLGATALYVVAMSGGIPVGHVVVKCRADVCSARRLRSHLFDFVGPTTSLELQRRFEPSGCSAIGASPPREVSIVVCSRNRAVSLDRCLTSLANLSGVNAQIVVVDNGDDDGATRDVAVAHGVDYVHEPVAGLDRARNRGVLTARHDIVVFTDDDVEVDPEWARHLAAAFDDPVVSGATGLVIPAVLETKGQIEFEMLAGFIRTVHGFTLDGTVDSPAGAGRAGSGASMAFRREFLLSTGGFPEILDGGRPTKSGGDTYALARVLRAGDRVRFVPASIVHHHHRPTFDDGVTTVEGYATGVVTSLLHGAVIDRDVAAALGAMRWFGWRVGLLVRNRLLRPDATVTTFVRAQVRGCVRAPLAWLQAVRTNTSRPLISRDRSLRSPRLPHVTHTLTGAVTNSTTRVGTHPTTISVVIPTQGTRTAIVELVTALRRQTHDAERFEIIIATDGPFHDRQGLIDRLGTDIDAQVVTGSTQGAGSARNRGAAAATGDVLLFLDDDVMPLDDGLVAAHLATHRSGERVVVGPIRPTTSDRPTTLELRERNWWSDQAEHVAGFDQPGDATGGLDFTDVCTGNLSIDRLLFEQLGGFGPYRRREDYELGLRLIAAGQRIASTRTGAVWHPAACTSRAALARRYREGVADCTLAARDPIAMGRLGIGSWPDLGARRRRLMSLAIRWPGPAASAAWTMTFAVGALDRLGSRRRLARLQDLTNDLAYWSGVGEIAGGRTEWRRMVASIERASEDSTAVLELDDASAWSPPVAGPNRFALSSSGVRIGIAATRWGGLPFDRSRFVERVGARFGTRARLLREASRA